jgi:hypothetical protein
VRQKNGRIVSIVFQRNNGLPRYTKQACKLLLRQPACFTFFRNAVFHVYTSFQKVKLALHQHYNASTVNVKLILHLRFKFYGKAVGRGPEKAPDKAGSAGSPERDADERRKFRETGWGPEREVFFQLQGADREYEALPDRDPERYEESAFGYGADGTEEDHHLRVDLDYSGDLVRGAVQLGRAVEQMMDDAPTRDGTTTSLHIDSKRRKKLKQKKTALGHAEDDHVDWTMEQHL